MRKWWLILVCVLFLTGCGVQQTMETVSDLPVVLELPEKQHADFQLPSSGVIQTMSDPDNGTVYFCDGYILTANTVLGGDLKKTVEQITGCGFDHIGILKTQQGDVQKYSFIWAAMGEEGEQLGRCVILDDGNYHYILSAMAGSSQIAELTDQYWNDIFASFSLMNPSDVVSSGS